VKDLKLSTLGAVVAIATLVAAIIIAIIIASGGITSTTTPILLSLVAILTPTIPALLALVKSEQASNDIKNGAVDQKIQAAIAKERDNNG